MSDYILFRSHRSIGHRHGSSLLQSTPGGSDWSHLRDYVDTDDVRDIAWKKIQAQGLSVRVREDTGMYKIMIYTGSTLYDDFFLSHRSETKRYTISQITDLMIKSAKYSGYECNTYTDENGIKSVMTQQPKNQIICIINSDISPEFRMMAYHNDLIFVDLYHPFEKNPNTDILFSGKILNMKKYSKKWQQEQTRKQKMIQEMGGSYIELSTLADISDTFNTFFKNRYHHG